MVPGQLLDSIPPHNEEAEKAALGAIMINPDAFSVVTDYIRPDDFYKNSHKKIFQAIINLSNGGETPDLLTLTDELKRQGELNAAGGPGYVASLTSAVPSSANVEYYAKIVLDCSIRRGLIRIGSEVGTSAHDETRESRQIVEEAERKIFELTDKNQKEKFKAAREIVVETINTIEKLYHTKDSYTGIPSGYSELDSLTSGFQKSDLIVIGARPSIGKTALALSIASNIAVKYKKPVGFFSLEMSASSIMLRLLSSEARINSRNLRSGLLKPSDFHDLTEASGRLYDAPLYINDTSAIKLLDLRSAARKMRSQAKVEIIFIDYISLIQSENTQIPRHEQVAEISRSLKSLARELEIPVVVLSQVKRETEGKQPNLADLRESGSIEQDADLVMFLHRDRIAESDEESKNKTQEIELIIAKQRNGPTDTIKLLYIRDYTRFESYTRERS